MACWWQWHGTGIWQTWIWPFKLHLWTRSQKQGHHGVFRSSEIVVLLKWPSGPRHGIFKSKDLIAECAGGRCQFCPPSRPGTTTSGVYIDSICVLRACIIACVTSFGSREILFTLTREFTCKFLISFFFAAVPFYTPLREKKKTTNPTNKNQLLCHNPVKANLPYLTNTVTNFQFWTLNHRGQNDQVASARSGETHNV